MLCSLALCSISVYAQRQIVGFVCDDANSSPIHGATVIQYQDSTRVKMLAYAITNKNGFFRLSSSNDGIGSIVVRYTGYEDLVVNSIAENDTLHLRMDKSSIQLGEVIVKGRYSGIKVKGDCIVFDVNHFKTGTEENVSDVLNSLPGVSVSGTGKISYAGRDINKVLVNGQEMMDVGSGMMINGLSSDIVSGVQILNNWKDGSIQEEYNDRNRTALNIETKKGTRTVGSVEGSSGILNKYELKPTLMASNEKFSLTAAGSSNNYGGEVFSIEEYMSSFVDLSSILNDGMGMLTLSESERLMLTPPQNVNKSRNSAIAINGVYRPSETLTIKSSVLLNSSKLNSLEDNSNYYFMSDFSSFERDAQVTTNNMLSANVNVRWKPSKRFELTSFTMGSYNDYGKSHDMEVSTFTYNLKAYQDRTQRKKQMSEALAANLRVGSNGLIFANASFTANSAKSDIGILSDSMLIQTKHILSGGFYEYGTYREVPSYSFNNELGYSHRFSKKRMLRLSVAYGNEREDVDSHGIADEVLQDKYISSRYSISARFSKQTGVLRYNIGNSVVWSHCKYAAHNGKTKAEWCPDMMLHLVFSPKQELRLAGQRSVSAASYERFLTYGMPLDYNSYRAASLMESPFVTKEQLLLHYRILEQYYNFLLFVNASYSREKGSGMDKVSQDGILSTHTYVDGGNTKNMALSATVRKGLGNMPVDAQLYTGYNFSSMPLIMGETISDYRMKRFSNSLTFSSRYLSAVNAEIKGAYEKTEINTSSYKTKSNEYAVSGKLMYAKNKWKGELMYSYEVIDGDLAYDSNHNIGFRLSYNLSHLYFRLSGSNLLHIRKYEWSETNTSTNYQSQTQYLRMPGYVLATMGWRF